MLLVTNYKPAGGGISVQVDLLKKNLETEGCDAYIFSTKGSPLKRLVALIKLIGLSKNYDAIHAHGCSGTGMIPIVFSIIAGKWWGGKRVVATYHGGGAESFFEKHTRFVKRYLMRTDVNIVLSGFLARVFDKYQIPYTIIPNVVELDEKAYRERKMIKPNFVSIRTLSSLYNIECIIRAFQIVKEKHPEAKLTIVGDGPSRLSLEKMVADSDIKDVSFIGRVPNIEIYKYLNDSDIMLSAPRVDNMPVSLLEAFNAGLLVISSNVGGVPYMIEDGENGLLFESDNYKMLSDRMIYAIENQDKTNDMITKAHECVAQYSWDEVKLILLKVYCGKI